MSPFQVATVALKTPWARQGCVCSLCQPKPRTAAMGICSVPAAASRCQWSSSPGRTRDRQWSPDEASSPYNMPRQIGRSSGAQRRGQPSARERGAAATSSIYANRSGHPGACPHGLPAGCAGGSPTGTSTSSSSCSYGSWSIAGTRGGYDCRPPATPVPEGPGPPSSMTSSAGPFVPQER